jgi:hypothetical protein
MPVGMERRGLRVPLLVAPSVAGLLRRADPHATSPLTIILIAAAPPTPVPSGPSGASTSGLIALVALVTGIVTTAGTLLATVLANRHNSQLDEVRRRNELAVLQSEWDREDRHRYNSNRTEAYAALLAAANGILSVGQSPELLRELNRRIFEASLLATPTVQAHATEVFKNIDDLIGMDDPTEESRKAVVESMGAFVNAARKELLPRSFPRFGEDSRSHQLDG